MSVFNLGQRERPFGTSDDDSDICNPNLAHILKARERTGPMRWLAGHLARTAT
jgi:hypothetical protein